MNQQTTTQKRVAIQGGYAAFHEIAARGFFKEEEISIVPCETFIDLFDAIEKDHVDFGIMAIENTVSGTILPNYALLRDSKLTVLGEHFLRIEQNLMVLPGTKIEEIKEVYSHHMAISQCRSFFKKYPHIKLIESNDTALSAKMVKDEGKREFGAIASALAAELYGLEIIGAGIETNKRNYTRFLVIGEKNKMWIPLNEIDKASLCFSVPHEPGSLSRVLSVLAFYGIDLTKIQSLPIIGREWQYLMFIDVSFHDYKRYRLSLDAIKPLTEDLFILGEYATGKKSFEEIHKINGF
jgi:prephenate dehydratase